MNNVEENAVAMPERHRAELDVEQAALWRKLISDTNAVPCKYPCLRDNLADWLADNGENDERK